MMFTYSEFELATILGSKHNSFQFVSEILKQSDKIFSKSRSRKGFLTLMAVFCMTYNFTEKLSKANSKGYKKPLDLVFNLNKQNLSLSRFAAEFPKHQISS